jgi:hypothetical protein
MSSTNLFKTLPTLSANGPGAAVDVSAMGAAKTINVGSGGGVYTPQTAIEASMDNVNWQQVAQVKGPTKVSVMVACHYMRANLSAFVDGVGPSVSVGGDNSGCGFTTLVALSGNGSGSAVGTSTTGPFKSVQVSGTFSGTVNVEISDDGGVTYNPVFSFFKPGIQSAVFYADHMRVTREGFASTTPGTPTVIVSDSTDGSGGGGGGSNSQELRYTAVGGETSFVVSWVTPRSDTNFNAHADGVGLARMVTFDCPVADYTTTSVTVLCSAPLTAGDFVAVSIVEITN